MRFYTFGEQHNPSLMLLPGTCCHWKGNFSHVIDNLKESFYVVCVSYDGFDEHESSEFTTMLDQTEKIETYIQKELNGKIHAVYGCSLGGSFVGLLAARKKIEMKYGILGSSDMDQISPFLAKIMCKIAIPLIYPLLTEGKFKLALLNKKIERRRKEMGEYVDKFMSLLKCDDCDMSFITQKSVENQFYSDLITPLPEKIECSNTEIHIFYALKMGEKYRQRYLKYFNAPIIHEHDLQHEELLIMYPDKWIKLIQEICL